MNDRPTDDIRKAIRSVPALGVQRGDLLVDVPGEERRLVRKVNFSDDMVASGSIFVPVTIRPPEEDAPRMARPPLDPNTPLARLGVPRSGVVH